MGQHLAGDAVAVHGEGEEHVLGAEVAVAGPLRLVGGLDERPYRDRASGRQRRRSEQDRRR
ncbi:MAG TPA: hypothetical protein VGP53_07300 [Acidimicrobiales bacterium]|nr:hypothetical protein [Acidimicrobiales bacterium]